MLIDTHTTFAAGVPTDCSYQTAWDDISVCVDFWYTLQPGDLAYLADTG